MGLPGWSCEPPKRASKYPPPPPPEGPQPRREGPAGRKRGFIGRVVGEIASRGEIIHNGRDRSASRPGLLDLVIGQIPQ